jgi:hypothetical protein
VKLRTLCVTVGALLGLFVVSALASLALIESQEVVVLTSYDERGTAISTRVWIVDYERAQFVAPGNATNAWFHRLVANPRAQLQRGDATSCRRAVVLEGDAAVPVLEQFLRKYSAVLAATSLLNRILEPGGDDGSAPLVLRLDPC